MDDRTIELIAESRMIEIRSAQHDLSPAEYLVLLGKLQRAIADELAKRHKPPAAG